MTVIGTPSEWVNLIDSLVPRIVDLVISTWQAMPPRSADALEDPITVELCRCLRINKDAGNLPFNIYIQQVELEPAAGQDQGRMDIVFQPLVPRKSIYFCLECKRLNVVNGGRVRSYATEYVLQGMMRFVRGQYSADVRHGGMLGYVLNDKVSQAIQNVANAIQTNHRNLGMEAPGEMRPSSIRPDNSRVCETHHTRQHNKDLFQIHHIFVPCASVKDNDSE